MYFTKNEVVDIVGTPSLDLYSRFWTLTSGVVEAQLHFGLTT